MNYKRQLTALMLSLVVLTGAMSPSFAENTTTANRQTTTQADTSITVSITTPQTEQNPTTSDPNVDETVEKQTASVAEDGSIQMPTIELNAKASLLVNAETGEIVHADNEREKVYPASCTKIMTALLTLENCDLDDVVTMTDDDFTDVKNGASNAGLEVGEKIAIEDLLYCLMLPSGNEAANALARITGGSIEEFAQMMNDRAKELGCVNTNFENPNGLHNENHYTCAYDMYLIAQQAMKNETFATIVNTAQKKLSATNKNDERIIYSTNELILSRYSSIYYDNCYGIKTGHTSQAGYCLVSYATKGERSYYSVVLGADAGTEYPGSFTETKRMFEWAFDNFSTVTATRAGTAITECSVRLGSGTDHVTLVTSVDVPVLVPKGLDVSDLDVSISVDESYDAPIAQGQKLGTVTYSYGDMSGATADLIALSEVKRSTVLYALDQMSQFFQQTAVRIIIGLVVLVCIVYLALSFISRRNRIARKRRAQLRARKRKRTHNNKNTRNKR